MEYRKIDLMLGGVEIESNEFDFGCTCIVQDALKAFEVDEGLRGDIAKFALTLVESVLYRMLRNKLKDFSLVKSLDAKTVMILFSKFQTWYREDMDYLNMLMENAKIEGLALSADKDATVDDSLAYIIYIFTNHLHFSPKDIKSWDFEDVAHHLYFSEKERNTKQFNENSVLM